MMASHAVDEVFNPGVFWEWETARLTRRSGLTLQASADGLYARTRWSALILGGALLCRLMVLWAAVTNYPHQWLYSRGIEMGLLADSLIHGLGYSSPFGGATGPTALIAPGYPTLIAAIFLVFGTYSFASAIAIMVLQIFVSLLTIWLMMHIARTTMDDKTANLAGGFWAISLPLLWIPTIFWETSISACMLTGMVALALRCQRRPGLAVWVAIGAYCGVAGLINPALLPTLCAVLLWVAYRTRRGGVRAPLLGAVTFLLVFAAWPIRNAVQFHAFIPTRTTVGLELWMGNREGATGYLDESVFPMYNKQELASYLSQGEVAYTQGKSEVAKRYILANPGIFFKMTSRRIVRFWSGTGTLKGSPVFAMHACLSSVLGIAGLVLLFRRRMVDLAMLMGLPLLLFPLPYYMTHAEFRYRLLLDPLLTILGAYAVIQALAARRDTVN